MNIIYIEPKTSSSSDTTEDEQLDTLAKGSIAFPGAETKLTKPSKPRIHVSPEMELFKTQIMTS